jgi:maltooligosyltrehalose trehalohydrolase
MSHTWILQRGALPQPDGVHFSIWAPRARQVAVRILTGASAGDHTLHASPTDPGVFEGVVAGTTTDTDYGYILDGKAEPLLPDPVSRWQPAGVHGPSRVVDPADFEWTDDTWRGLRMADYVIYELHVGTFTDEGTFDAAISELRGLVALGVTAIEIMPVAQFPGDRNWGYDGVSLYAVQNSYGGPDGLKRFVDAAHAHGLAVIIDAVYNHVGPEGNYLGSFGPYFTDKYKTPWGSALNYDDAQSDEVRRFIIDNALYWITEYHADGLRLDAVHGIFDFSAKHLLQELAEVVHEQGARLGREVVIIAESDLNDPKLIRSIDEFGYGLDAQWSDDFHHAVHAALTGERNGYYSDFGAVAHIAASLEEPFVYSGTYSSHRQRRHGASSVGLPRDRFVVAVQNHDQVGNRAIGDRLANLLEPAQLRLAAALLLLSPYVPLLFMGEEYAETNPFLYFVSHGDPGLVESVRKGRRSEFEAFGWGDDVPDPQSPETFARSRLDRRKMTLEPHAQLLALYRDLLALRRDEPMLRPGAAAISVDHGEAGWIALLREQTSALFYTSSPEDRGQALLTLFNCSPNAVEVPIPPSARGPWTLRFTTDASDYGGMGGATISAIVEEDDVSAEQTGHPKRLLAVATPPLAIRAVSLPAWSAAVYERTDNAR